MHMLHFLHDRKEQEFMTTVGKMGLGLGEYGESSQDQLCNF